MSTGAEDGDLAGLTAADSLIDAPADVLPADVPRPPAPTPDGARGRIVGAGVLMTGVTLVVGIALAVVGVVELLSGHGERGLAALIVGLALAGTHWGWVHVAELTANASQARHDAPVREARRQWLSRIAPFDRFEIITSAGSDGEIAIERVHLAPVAVDGSHFAFTRTATVVERHPAEMGAAVVAERAELIRREAQRDTERARERYELATGDRETARLSAERDAQARDAEVAASRALTEQINAHLRDPPLSE